MNITELKATMFDTLVEDYLSEPGDDSDSRDEYVLTEIGVFIDLLNTIESSKNKIFVDEQDKRR